MRARGTTALILAWLAGWAVPAAAQQAAAPRSAEPGQIERRIERPVGPVAPRSEVAPVAPGPRLNITAAPGTFVLSGVDIDGATVYRSDELAKLYEPLLARRISLAEIEGLLAAITRKYHEDGYILSHAVAPPQKVDLGILKIHVIEGYVARVLIPGAGAGDGALLRDYARPVVAQHPLTRAVLERQTLLMGDLPGITVSPAIVPIDEAAGRYELHLAVTRKAVAGSVGFDNRGTDAVGPLKSYATVELNGLIGNADATRLTFFTVPNQPRELLYAEVRHDEPIGTDGARLALAVSRSWVDAGDDLRLFRPQQPCASRRGGCSLPADPPAKGESLRIGSGLLVRQL